MRIGSLFSGIGGLELGLEWAGVGETVFQVEKDPACLYWLQQHWPDVPRWDDVSNFREYAFPPDVDVLCGGFPCQDISQIGKQRGITGERSGLWKEFARIIRNIRPRFVVVENVARLRRAGLDVVLADLAALGYDAEWSVVSACAVGASQTRERLFILAYADHPRLEGHARHGDCAEGRAQPPRPTAARGLPSVADATRWWATEPDVGAVAHGVPDRVALLTALGNAVVPQVAYVVGKRLLEIDAEMKMGLR